MKKILSIIILLSIFSFKSFAAPDGKGQIQLSENVVKNFINYIVGDIGTQKSLFNKPGTFWITIDGSRSFWWYTPQGAGIAIRDPSAEKAKCERHHGQSCSRFARGRYVRWDNGINPKGKAAKFSSKMSESEVRAKLTKLGFYNNDFLDTTSTPKITKKKETKKVEKKITKKITKSDADIVSKLKDLKDLLDSGVLTKEEFEKAKKKLLN
jgi:hypothetical protein